MNAFEIMAIAAKYPSWKIYNKCITTAKSLKGKLPESRHHPLGRNETAHVFMMIKSKFGCSYKEVIQKDELWKYIDWLKENPC